MKKKLRIDLVLVIILVMFGFILSTFGFIHTMLKYTRIGNISKDDLQYEQLTFEKYNNSFVVAKGLVTCQHYIGVDFIYKIMYNVRDWRI